VILVSVMICPICGISEKRDDAHRCMLFFTSAPAVAHSFVRRQGIAACSALTDWSRVRRSSGWRRRNAPSGPGVAERQEIVKLALRKENKAMAQGQRRKIEIFSAGCTICTETVELVRRVAGSAHDIEIHDMHRAQVAARAKAARDPKPAERRRRR